MSLIASSQITISAVYDGEDGQNAVTGVLSNETHTLSANSSGTVSSYAGAVTTMSVFDGATDDSANWTYSAVAGTGVTGSLNGRTYTVTGLSTDSGYVDITATKGGVTVTKRFVLAKSKQGATGGSATSYWLVNDVSAIKKDSTGAYTPSSIAINGKYQVGTGTPTAYAGRFIIAESTDGTNYTDKYTSGVNESSKTYVPSAGIKAIRVRMYLANGTTTLLDEQVIPIVADGSDGADGTDGIDATLGYSRNPYFKDWGALVPTGYGTWNGTAIKETNITNRGGSAVRFNVASNIDTGIVSGGSGSTYAFGTVPELDYYTIEFDVYISSATSLKGAGLIVDFVGLDGTGVTAYNRVNIALEQELIAYKTGSWYQIRKVIPKAKTSWVTWQFLRIYLMANWTGFPSAVRDAKDITYDYLEVRQSTQAEIEAYTTARNINNAITTIDETGVTVKNGNFFLVDESSSTKYVLENRTNLLNDHSFEMLETTGVIDATYNDFSLLSQQDFGRWYSVGSPRLFSTFQTDVDAYIPFGNQAVVVNSTNYVVQEIKARRISEYYVSAHFKTSLRGTAGSPIITAEIFDVNDVLLYTYTQTFTPPSASFLTPTVYRYSLRFITPSNTAISYMRISLKSSSASYVMVDGAMVTRSPELTDYDAEDSVWKMRRGVDKYPIINDIGGNILKPSRIEFPANSYWASGGAMDLQNSDILGVNNIIMSDTATGDGEAIQWVKSTTPAGSVSASDYDSFRIYNGIGYLNSKAIFQEAGQVSLWTGGMYMASGQTVTPTKAIADCPNGWCLVWSEYDGTNPQNFDFNYTFVPKWHVASSGGTGVWCLMGLTWDSVNGKYVYVNPTNITGHANNNTGVRNQAVLRAVLSY